MKTQRMPRVGGRGTPVLRPIWWILGMLAVAGVFSAAYWGFVLTATGQRADELALRGAAYLDADLARRPALALLGDLPAAAAILLAVAVLAAAIARRDLVVPAIALAGFGAAVASTQLLKHVVLERPDKNISEASMNSFPSGHTTFAAAAMVAVFLLCSPRWRPLAAVFGGFYAAAAGGATFVLGWHRPADILAAYLVAAFWGLLAGLVIVLREPGWNTWNGPGSHWAAARAWTTLLWVPGVLGIAGAIVVYWRVSAALAPGSEGSLLGHLLAGVLFIVGAASFLFALGSAFFSWQTSARR
ncbi:phosphatase PAP2 family protein [Zafaria sp. J156]|uniref:phosphatase PAP2 family protein n=1 Tax=Zafaria sp. J156 TaxID=3116490 RepID=UPI002E75BEE5|nr:phosphatase PAP2 family protein [Zafaria sp. J156]MEE1621261.1 phosphatase PAP2 family protein [Zafaria sp. J156]